MRWHIFLGNEPFDGRNDVCFRLTISRSKRGRERTINTVVDTLHNLWLNEIKRKQTEICRRISICMKSTHSHTRKPPNCTGVDMSISPHNNGSQCFDGQESELFYESRMSKMDDEITMVDVYLVAFVCAYARARPHFRTSAYVQKHLRARSIKMQRKKKNELFL